MHLSTVMQQLVTFWSNYLTCLASIINDTPLSLFLCLFLFIKYIFIFPLAFLQICWVPNILFFFFYLACIAQGYAAQLQSWILYIVAGYRSVGVHSYRMVAHGCLVQHFIHLYWGLLSNWGRPRVQSHVTPPSLRIQLGILVQKRGNWDIVAWTGSETRKSRSYYHRRDSSCQL